MEGIDLTGEALLIVSPISKKGRPQGLVLLDTLKFIPAEVPDNLPGLVAPPAEGFTTFIQEYFIDRIDVLKSAGPTAGYGVRGSNGVISIITRTGDRVLPNVSVNHSVNVNISGYDAARVFYSPQHSTSSVPAYEPDLRTTLFWEPDIHLRSSENVSLYYYNTDKASTIQVNVEGITTSGIPVTSKTEYKIKE